MSSYVSVVSSPIVDVFEYLLDFSRHNYNVSRRCKKIAIEILQKTRNGVERAIYIHYENS